MLNGNLIALRKKRKITQDEVADFLQVKRQTYSAYERGVSVPDAYTLQKLADYFGVTTDFLLSDGSAETQLSEDSLEYALYGEAKELDEEEKQQLLSLAKLMRKKREEFFEKDKK